MTRRQIVPESRDQFVLLVSRAGSACHLQFGRSGVTQPGKMILIHGRAPYQVRTEVNMASMFINIPGAMLRSVVAAPEDYCMIAMDAGRGINALFCELTQSIWHKLDEISNEQAEFLSAEFLRFFAAALESIEARALLARPRSRADDHFDRAMRYIDANLGDLSLSVEQVAQALCLSRGRLHAIGRDKGTSIAQSILDRRLERCREALADARNRYRPITQIAFDWGFRNSAHFSQAFKAKFGLPPRLYRQQHLQLAG